MLLYDPLGVHPNLSHNKSFVSPLGDNGWDFPEEIPGEVPGNALRAFPGIPLESTAGVPQTLSFTTFEAARAFAEFSLPQYGWARLFFFQN